MMDVIRNRRSVRRYTADPVKESMINDLLEAAMCAPSGNNEKPWQFVVINDRNILDTIPVFHPYASALKRAQVAILVCGDLSLEKTHDLWIQDCAAATQNILLEAQSEGLGAVWLGLYPEEDRVSAMRKLLLMPEYIIPFAIIPVGYPDESHPVKNRFDVQRVRYNKW